MREWVYVGHNDYVVQRCAVSTCNHAGMPLPPRDFQHLISVQTKLFADCVGANIYSPVKFRGVHPGRACRGQQMHVGMGRRAGVTLDIRNRPEFPLAFLYGVD